jgi:uncharacterized membrane protein YgcG
VTPERAQRVLAARRARITRIRKAVATASVVIFVALFSAIYVQMATGSDPVLGTHSTQKSSSSTAAANSGSSVSSGNSGSSGSSGSDNSSVTEIPESATPQADPGTTLTPMTTSQS